MMCERLDPSGPRERAIMRSWMRACSASAALASPASRATYCSTRKGRMEAEAFGLAARLDELPEAAGRVAAGGA
jgi:hypothetical protein